MPAKDIYHNAVKNALIKDGWEITADPFFIIYQKLRLVADLSAERSLSAQKRNRKIVVEIKSFLNPSFIYDFERAVGQYVIYRSFIQKTTPEYILYLALTQLVYQANFDDPVQSIIDENQINVIVVNPEQEVITRWIN